MRNKILSILILVSIILVSMQVNSLTTIIYLEDTEIIQIICDSDNGNITYNVTNDNGVLIVTLVNVTVETNDTGHWGPWSPWWIMRQVPEDNIITHFIVHQFGGQVNIESQQVHNHTISLSLRWNIFTAPKDKYVNNILVIVKDKTLTWEQASRNRIVYRYIFDIDWQRIDYLNEGQQYRAYAFQECSLLF